MFTLILLITIVAIFLYWWNTKDKTKLKAGYMAPDFSLQDETGAWRKLSDFSDKKVVLYFYPKDDTPGCTAEACGLRDMRDVYANRGIVVLGVSYDSPESHRAFKEKYQLPFMLLSDTDKSVSKAYGAYTPLYAKRMTFLIDGGQIKHIYTNINVTAHAQEILEKFDR